MTLEQVKLIRAIAEENKVSYKVMVDNGRIGYHIEVEDATKDRNLGVNWLDDKQLLVVVTRETEQWAKTAMGRFNTCVIPYEWIEWIELCGELVETINCLKSLGIEGEEMDKLKKKIALNN